jgi:hypothetical protein
VSLLRSLLRKLLTRAFITSSKCDHPANLGPDPETVADYVYLWTDAGVEEPRATAAGLEFLIHYQSTGEKPTIAPLNKWAHSETAG